jgi:Holliday junction resolvasome RuvABC endonuclease subunit
MVNLSVLNSPPEKICAIDASTNSLAFAIFDGKSLEVMGKINFSGRTAYAKAADACNKIKDFFVLFEIEAVVIEQAIHLNSPKTMSDLSIIQGAIVGGIAISQKTYFVSVPPITWQTYIGNGKLSHEEKGLVRKSDLSKSESWYKNKEREFRKQKTINFVNTYYDKTVSDNDVADAVGIGHYAVHNLNKLFSMI